MLQLTRDKYMPKSSDSQIREDVRKAATSMSGAMFALRSHVSAASGQYEVKTSGSFSSLEKRSTDSSKKK